MGRVVQGLENISQLSFDAAEEACLVATYSKGMHSKI